MCVQLNVHERGRQAGNAKPVRHAQLAQSASCHGARLTARSVCVKKYRGFSKISL